MWLIYFFQCAGRGLRIAGPSLLDMELLSAPYNSGDMSKVARRLSLEDVLSREFWEGGRFRGAWQWHWHWQSQWAKMKANRQATNPHRSCKQSAGAGKRLDMSVKSIRLNFAFAQIYKYVCMYIRTSLCNVLIENPTKNMAMMLG